MALSNDALATLAAVKQYLTIAGTENDELIERLIEAVSARFMTNTGRLLAARDFSPESADPAYDPDNAVLSGSGHSELLLPQYPVVSLSSLAIDGRAVSPSAAAGDGGYVVDRLAGVVMLSGAAFPRGPANVAVAYRAGYETVPPDLAQAAIEQTAEAFEQSSAGQGRLGQSARTLADGSVSYQVSELLPSVAAVLERYRRRSLL